jgi:hypothetical protein
MTRLGQKAKDKHHYSGFPLFPQMCCEHRFIVNGMTLQDPTTHLSSIEPKGSMQPENKART